MLSGQDSFAGLRFAESEAMLHDRAAAEVGSDDFGDPSYLEGLRVLLRAYDQESKLNAYGHEDTFQKVLDLLKKRLRAEQMWKQNPALADVEIRRPIIICGLVRTGSTALHYLMGQDPGMQNLEYWLASSPQPRPPREVWEHSGDFQASVAEIDAMYAADPSLKAVHFMMPDGPEECRHLLSQSFTDDGFEVNASIPTFSQWYENTSLEHSYRQHRRLLQIIGSNDGHKRWLLKYPVHMRNLPDLFKVYPDACIVWTHRDPAQVLPSYCSLIAGFRAIWEDNTDPRHMAERQLELWARGAEKAIACRRERDPAQFYDLYFDDFMAKPIESVKRIYAYFGQQLSEQGEERMRAWNANNPQHKHGIHDYSDEIGVDSQAIHDQFAAYMDAYGVKAE